ncbi:MAG: GAF domain-containing sensor histidine kinase [Actinomycetota bacterium]
MHLGDLWHPVRPASPARIAATAIGFPAVATGLALAINRTSGVTAVSLYLLAVVLAAAAAGVWGGLLAAALSFAGYIFFFTAPRYTFRVAAVEDVVAAVVLLLVALVVGLLVARVLEERERTERRERDARLLGYLAAKLLSGEQLSRVLDDFAQALLDPFDLIRCEVQAVLDGQELQATAVRLAAPQEAGPTETVPIAIGETPFGTVQAVRRPGAHAFTTTEHGLLEATAKQAALAIERARLDMRVRGAQLDAETNQIRAALFSSVTHDLRTPLASIKASVTSLLSETAVHDASQQRELLTTVLEETDRLNRVVGNLMDLAKIRAGALEPAREPAAVDELVQAVVARMRPQLAEVSVRSAIRPDLPDVFVDPVQIDQVLTNLLENAALHSPPGGEISITAAPFLDVVQVRVADHGPGIPADDRERVFEAFYRGDAAPERPGSGLGLAIARAVVVAHGGKIWVEGAPGGGTVIVFELPIWEEQR